MAKQNLSWPIIVALGVAAVYLFSKMTGAASPFTGVTSQRGLAGTDQFGNPITPANSGWQGQGILSA